jgi:hypothetical protein
LKVCHKKHWVVLHNSDGSPLEGRNLEAKEKIHQGMVMNFASHMVCVNCLDRLLVTLSPYDGKSLICLWEQILGFHLNLQPSYFGRKLSA